jgi:hypothetical protein
MNALAPVEVAVAMRPERVAKLIGDLDDLVRLLRTALPRTKPWQRQLAEHLAAAYQLIEVLRLTVALERADSEILAAAKALNAACQRVESATAGSRADATTKASVRLALNLSRAVINSLHETRSRELR